LVEQALNRREPHKIHIHAAKVYFVVDLKTPGAFIVVLTLILQKYFNFLNNAESNN